MMSALQLSASVDQCKALLRDQSPGVVVPLGQLKYLVTFADVGVHAVFGFSGFGDPAQQRQAKGHLIARIDNLKALIVKEYPRSDPLQQLIYTAAVADSLVNDDLSYLNMKADPPPPAGGNLEKGNQHG